MQIVPLNRRDKDVFDQLYDLYYTKLFQIVRHYIQDPQDAEEILQDVFMKVWNKVDQIDLSNNFTGYLYRITRNTCLDYLRSKKIVLHIESGNIQKLHALNYEALADEQASTILEKELQQEIDRALTELPEKCRNVFKKSRYEGKAHKEISEELDISTKTVEDHIGRALKHLKIRLSEYLR